MEQLSAQDAQFLFMEDADIVANITGAYICDQSTAPDSIVRFRTIVETIEKRLEHCPFFKRKLMRVPMELDYPYWVDDPHFDIEYHVRHARLPNPADWRQFCIHFARFHSRPLDMGRPLWEVYVVEGLDNVEGVPKGAFAMMAKVHHAAVDGVAGLQMLGALMDLTPKGPPAFRYPPRPRRPEPPLSISDIMTRAAFNNARSPLRLMEAVGKSSPQIARALAVARSGKSAPGRSTPPSPFNQAASPNKAFDAVEFSLADFKTIRTAYPEAKINDIVLSVTGGGIRRYLEAKRALPKQSLTVMAPINARAASRSGREGAGNNISAMTVPLHTHIAHPVERLKAIVLSTRKSKAAKDGVGARLLTDLTQQAPSSMMALASRFIAQRVANGEPLANLIVSNVPGPQAPLYFCGAEMTSMFAMAPLSDGMGLFIAAPSYNGKLALCLTSTRQIIPDTPFFTECLKEAFEELKAAALRRLHPPKKKKKAVAAAAIPDPAAPDKPKKKKKKKKRDGDSDKPRKNGLDADFH
ncbi:MAG: wax ester/triacylglycerol synthase family O-acyltransferase [Parvularculaceae bacterium]